ncbi:ELMO domain-containing protein 3 [Halotydeus destructor]|nr:ELMO domain-containing protein 3 [Halotydeus destructor]
MAEADLNIDSEGQSKVGESESDAFERAQQEWDNIKPLPIISLSDQGSADGSIFTEQNSGILTIEEADGYIAILDISEELKYIKPSAEQRGFISFLRKIFLLNAPTMRSTGCRNRIFAIAMKPLDAKDTVHSKLLTTIYHKLTRQPVIKCPRYGNHWEEIGFQGERQHFLHFM